tara:strand:- start:248 stop:418 length:171 start_codon:yes stop_codon:yes gene_type:complete
MATQTRAKKLIKMMKRLMKNEFLYTDEELKDMRAQLRVLEEELALQESKNSKGFGK